jgi:hypothetical protein
MLSLLNAALSAPEFRLSIGVANPDKNNGHDSGIVAARKLASSRKKV